MSSLAKILGQIQENDVKFVDLRFTGTNGQWHRLSYHVSEVDEAFLQEGVLFDGSSIKGWRAIHESDMRLQPDLTSGIIDPFAAQSTLVLFADVYDPLTGAAYSHDPRGVAKRAEDALRASGMADIAFFGPEPEFFVFDNVRYEIGLDRAAYHIDSDEISTASGRLAGEGVYRSHNSGHRPGIKGGYFATYPLDSVGDMRAEMITTLALMGVGVEKHHHEVAAAQHELGIKFNTLVKTADALQIYKYVVKSVAQTYGKTATFMPKPMQEDNGSGMHVHQSLWKGNAPLFAGDKYAGLSDEALYYIGGILHHAQALNAFTNPTTNSYKRLVPGYEAPVLLAYSQANRSAACRIPAASHPKQKRVEMRFPDPTANPYLALAALMMAGLDGMRRKIHPGEAVDHNLFEDQAAQENLPTMAETLEQALDALAEDYEFLLHHDVFSEEMIFDYIALKYEDVLALQQTPHPLEFALYYSS